MHVAIGLTFAQELIKEIVGALATALLVTIAGTVVVNNWSARRDERRARFELRNDLLKRSTHLAQEMYTKCQHTRRVLRTAQGKEREEALYYLDSAYLEFATAGQPLEFELGARYGFTDPGDVNSRDGANGVWEGWHQIRDLLTVYYFNLKAEYPGNVLERNARGYEGGFHSGLDLAQWNEDFSGMRRKIRATYEGALRRLVEAILSDDIITEKSR
jgi:hypothetical protein